VINHSAANPQKSEGSEITPPVRIEATSGFHQTQEAGAYEILAHFKGEVHRPHQSGDESLNELLILFNKESPPYRSSKPRGDTPVR
jgi:hypothetical protein